MLDYTNRTRDSWRYRRFAAQQQYWQLQSKSVWCTRTKTSERPRERKVVVHHQSRDELCLLGICLCDAVNHVHKMLIWGVASGLYV